jgi:hypothetical protein
LSHEMTVVTKRRGADRLPRLTHLNN